MRKVIAHEGSHIEDAQRFAATYNPATRMYSRSANYTVEQAERKAYSVSDKVKPVPPGFVEKILEVTPNKDWYVWPEKITR
jgi:hypothetical protein